MDIIDACGSIVTFREQLTIDLSHSLVTKKQKEIKCKLLNS